MWVPSAGYFVLADIETVDLEEHHYYHEGFAGRLPKDYAFCLKLCKEDGVIAIPCSSFFGKHKKNKDNLVRFAFCKDDMSIMEAGRRLREEPECEIDASQYSSLRLCAYGS
jgi:aspartate/methionine/tyrosine aminotransferase